MASPTNAERRLIIAAAMISGNVYIVLVFIVGVLLNNPVAYDWAIATAAACYFSYLAQLLSRNVQVGALSVVLTIICGATAGFSLLW
jgi:hypothetical protein